MSLAAVIKWKRRKDEREDVQKKTFTKWINSQLGKGNHPLVKDLFYDLRDGTRLLGLLEVLCGKELRRERGRLRVHHLNNVGCALKVLQDNNVKLVNISTNDIVDGNPKLTLGLVWSIILHWQVHGVLRNASDELPQTNLEKTLLAWCHDATTGYAGVNIRNFTTCWSDGLAFNAIIHRFRPQIFDYDALMKKDVNSRLEHAFQIAYKYLGIDKLLDPEDVNTSLPDKKSVMMYVMCFFQSLHNQSAQSIPLRRLDSAELSDESAEASHLNYENDITSYQTSLEDVLTCLLEDEEKLREQSTADNLDCIKEQFHEHESFMLELTKHQQGVEKVLFSGNQLLTQGKVTSAEQEEIVVQMQLLNDRWQDIRSRALERQNDLHEKFMNLQKVQLDNISKWLSEMENKLDHLPPIGPNLDELKKQVETQKHLMDEIERKRDAMNSITKIVFVMADEENSQIAYTSLKKQLAQIEQQWASVCHAVSERSTLLQSLVPQWQQLEDEELCFSQWLQRKEQQLSTITLKPGSDSRVLLEQVKLLQSVEQDLDIHHRLFNQLTERAQKIKEQLEVGSLGVIEITEKIEKLTHRWDALVLLMESLSKKLANMEEEKIASTNRKQNELVHSPPSDSGQEENEQGGAKKRRLDSWRMQEWYENYEAVNLWLDRAESTMGIAAYEGSGTDPWDTLCLDDQQVLLEDTEADFRAQKGKVEKLLSQGTQVIKDLESIGENPLKIQKIMRDVESRWKALVMSVENQKRNVQLQLDADRLRCEKDALELILNSQCRWMEAAQRSMLDKKPDECRRMAEQCKLRLTSLQGHEEKIEKLRKETNEVKKKSPSLMSFAVEVDQFCKEWDVMSRRLAEMERSLNHAMLQAPPVVFMDAAQSLDTWLVNVHQALISEQISVAELDQMEEQLSKLKELQSTIEEEQSNLEYVRNTKNQLLKTDADAPWVGELNHQVQHLESTWSEVCKLIRVMMEGLEKYITKLQQFQNEISGLMNWMQDVDQFLAAEDPAVGDMSTLEAQLEQSNALQDDIKTLGPNVERIETTGKELIDNAGETPFATEIREQISSLKEKWEKVIEQANNKNIKLKEAVNGNNELTEIMSELSEWLQKLETEIPEDNPISNSSDLMSKNKKLQFLLNKIERRQQEYEKLSSTFKSISDSPQQNSFEIFSQEFQNLQSKWDGMLFRIKELSQKYKEMAVKYNEFCNLVMRENDWLDRLEKKLKRSPESAADAEEISENLDDLENYLRHHPTDRVPKIQNIGQFLISNDVLVTPVERDVNLVTRRFEELSRQGRDRQQLLESSIAEAQQCERHILTVQAWISHIDTVLQNRLDNDISSQDVPEELTQLEAEFAEKEESIKALQEDVENYRSRGRIEAAHRLEEQLRLVEEKFCELQEKFIKFQTPCNFGNKLNHIGTMLNEVEDGLNSFQFSSEESDSSESQLEKCLVTETRAHLESAVKKDNNLEAEIFHFQEWLHAARMDADKTAPEKTKNVSELEIQLCNDILSEVRNKKNLLDSLFEKAKNSEESSEENVKELQHEYSMFEQKLMKRIETLKGATKEYSKDFFQSLAEVKNWLQSAGSFVYNFEKLSRKQKLSESQQERLKHLQEELVSIEQKKNELIQASNQMGKLKEKFAVKPELVEVEEKFEILSSKIQNLVTNQEIDVKRATIEQLRASPVQLPTSEPGSPKIEEIGLKIRQLNASIDEFGKFITNKTNINNFDSVIQLKEEIKCLNEKSNDLEENVDDLQSEWRAHGRKDDVSSSRLSNQMKELTDNYQSVSDQAKEHCQNLHRKIELWSDVERKHENLSDRLQYLLSNFKDIEKAPVSRQKALEDEAKNLQTEFENLQQKATEVGASKILLQKLLRESTTNLAGLSMRLDELETLKQRSVKTALTQTDKNQVIVIETSNFAIVPDFIAKVNKVREAIAAVNRQLNQPELAGKDFEDFGRQEGSLKGIKDGMNALKPNVELVCAEKENIVKKASKTDAAQIVRVSEKLNEEWNKLNTAYDERYKKWQKSCEVWQGFESDLRSMTSWLVSSETILAHSRLQNGDLDYERARMHQEMLQKQVSEKMAIMEGINVTGHKVLDQCSAPDAILLQEQLDSLNKRWKSLVAELATRKTKLDEDKSTLAVVKDEMEDLTSWLKETETLLCGTPRTTDLSNAKVLLGKLKEHEQDIPSRRSSLLTIMLAGPLVNVEDVEILEQRYAKVTGLLPDRRQNLETYVNRLSKFQEEAVIENNWLRDSRKLLEERLALYSAGRTVSDISEVTKEDVESHHKIISKLVQQQNELESAAQKSSLILSPSVKRTTSNLASEWAAVSQVLKKLRPYERCPSPIGLETIAPLPSNSNILEARRSRTTFGGTLPTSGPGKIWADQLCELIDWLESQDLNLQMQVVDVTDENAVVSVIEKVQSGIRNELKILVIIVGLSIHSTA
ncbi:dystrophin [Nephila pilipes]|uniref:Dystrophin n=1 Tax=Nephila pilipes TaxID=299642 RepID=A0A8X6MRI3_NEPPI|nr:dystrophin [Nephila pilipes]